MIIRLQFSRWRYTNSRYRETGPPIKDVEFKNHKKISLPGQELTPETLEEVLRELSDIVSDRVYAGTSQAYWRLVLEEDVTKMKTVKVGSDELTVYDGRIGISPLYKQSVEGEAERILTDDRSWALGPEHEGEELLAAELDETPVPHGTVVQILDEWGDTVDSTKVV